VFDLFTDMLVGVNIGVEWTFVAFECLDIENRERLVALCTFRPVVVRRLNGTVGNVIVQSTSSIVLLNYSFN
jgi:hypothetical protein